MAKNLLIQKKDNITKIFLDGNEIRNVISYELSERADQMPSIKLEVCITDEIEVQLK
mgnify:CR=1 FL=1